MNYPLLILTVLVSSWVSDFTITVLSTHEFVRQKLILSFTIECVGRETSVFGFLKVSNGTSPNEYCDIVLYDKYMEPINSNAGNYLHNRSSSIESMHVKLSPTEPINFVCRVDTSSLIYLHNPPHIFKKARYCDVVYYKLYYKASPYRPKKAVGDFESQLFTLK